MNVAENKYKEIAKGINTFRRTEWESCIRSTLGTKVILFAYYVVAQYARMDGRFYEDYSHETHGYRNYDRTCSVMADARNDQAIRRCSKVMESQTFAERTDKVLAKAQVELIPYADLYRPCLNETGELVRLCVTGLHRTLQQSLVSGCLSILKQEHLLPDGISSYMTMI